MIKLVYPEFWSKISWQSYLLTPVSWIYQLLGLIRRLFAKPVKLNAKVICVGNMSVGGTGKTQIVLHLATELTRQKRNFIIITKGYGSSLSGAKIVSKNDKASEVGDESILLSKIATVIAAKNIKSALPLIEQLKPEIIIFDDGMQNPGFIKDVNILVIDSDRATGNGLIFPSGPLREYSEIALHRADMIIMIGNNPCSNFALVTSIASSKKPLFKAKIKITTQLDPKAPYYAFTAIGNPERFYQLLEDNKISIQGKKSFPDHYNYTKEEISDLQQMAKTNQHHLLTTRKDFVKITNSSNITSVDVELEIDNTNKYLSYIL